MIAPETIFQSDKMCGLIIGGCHTLANTDGNLVGDPLEKTFFELSKLK